MIFKNQKQLSTDLNEAFDPEFTELNPIFQCESGICNEVNQLMPILKEALKSIILTLQQLRDPCGNIPTILKQLGEEGAHATLVSHTPNKVNSPTKFTELVNIWFWQFQQHTYKLNFRIISRS